VHLIKVSADRLGSAAQMPAGSQSHLVSALSASIGQTSANTQRLPHSLWHSIAQGAPTLTVA